MAHNRVLHLVSPAILSALIPAPRRLKRRSRPVVGPVRLAAEPPGREVTVLADGPARMGWHLPQWGASAASSGVYCVRLATPERQIVQMVSQ